MRRKSTFDLIVGSLKLQVALSIVVVLSLAGSIVLYDWATNLGDFGAKAAIVFIFGVVVAVCFLAFVPIFGIWYVRGAGVTFGAVKAIGDRLRAVLDRD